MIPKKVTQAQKAAEKAGRLIEKGAKRKKIRQQLRRMEKALGVIEKKVNNAERSTKEKKHISPACAARLRALLADPRAALGELQL